MNLYSALLYFCPVTHMNFNLRYIFEVSSNLKYDALALKFWKKVLNISNFIHDLSVTGPLQNSISRHNITINSPYYQPVERQTRHYHPLHFILPTSTFYEQSFYSRSIKEWNELPVAQAEKSLSKSCINLISKMCYKSLACHWQDFLTIQKSLIQC